MQNTGFLFNSANLFNNPSFLSTASLLSQYEVGQPVVALELRNQEAGAHILLCDFSEGAYVVLKSVSANV
jgi:hypothetical protein